MTDLKPIVEAWNFLAQLAVEVNANGKVHERRIEATRIVAKFLEDALKAKEIKKDEVVAPAKDTPLP